MKKQTAVEFLIDEIRNRINENRKLDALTISILKMKAKSIEKQQIGDAYWDGVCDWDDTKNSYHWDQYYDKTFL
jgi:hypothetical protein